MINQHIGIKVVVTIDGQLHAKHTGVDPMLSHQHIDDYVADWVADQWKNHAAERITKIYWVYV